jgi:hypothetical protein
VFQDGEVMGEAVGTRESAMAAAEEGMLDRTRSRGSEILYKVNPVDLQHGMIMGESGFTLMLMVLRMGRQGVLVMEVLVLFIVDPVMVTMIAGGTTSTHVRDISKATRQGFTELCHPGTPLLGMRKVVVVRGEMIRNCSSRLFKR